MPTFAVYTNLPNDKVPGDFLQQASAFLANQLGKPESVCCHFFLCVLSRLNIKRMDFSPHAVTSSDMLMSNGYNLQRTSWDQFPKWNNIHNGLFGL